MELLKPNLTSKNINLLVHLTELLILDSEFEYDEIYEHMDDNIGILQEYSNLLNLGKINQVDVEFMSMMIIMNFELIESYLSKQIDKNELISKIQIPKEKKYYVDSQQRGPATFEEIYRTELISFSEELASKSWEYIRQDDFWRYSKVVDYYADNFEPESHEISNIREIATESLSKKNKLINENTEKVLRKTDKSTLLELRKLIDFYLSR